MVSDTKAVKSVGEFWTCCKLAMNGWAPALTRDGLERTDILAERSHAPFDVTQISVQVKTSRNERWALNPAKIGSQRSLYEWFVLVGWNENEQTLSSYIVPRNHVSAGAWLGHMRWLTDPTAKRNRNCGPEQARMDVSVFGDYKDRWDLLLKPTSQTPILLPHELNEFALIADASNSKLPEWHPWSGDSLPEW